MKFFHQGENNSYSFETTDSLGNASPWAARLGAIANLKQSIENGVFRPVETDREDAMVIMCAEVLMSLIHVFGHAGNRFLFTGLIEGSESQMGVRFFDQERTIEVHVWSERSPILIVIYHFHTNVEYRIRVVPNFR